MTDDLLARATRALREDTADDDASARFTRSRIMASTHERRVRSRTRVAFLIPIAATFVAASAIGATGGPRQALEAVARVFGVHRAEPALSAVPAAGRGSDGARRPVPRAEVAPKLEPPLVPPPPPTAEAKEPEPATVRAEPPRASSSGSAGREASDPGFELYRVAHRAHFVDHAWERALTAWDAYLRAAPRGSFVLEARYNRALCLARLKRTAEARVALEPFAKGRYGGYRQEDAAKLVSALAE